MNDEATLNGRPARLIRSGEALLPVRLDLRYATVVGQIAGTRDFTSYHHDPEAAKAQGQRTIYVNTMFFEAFLDRVALEWAGPTWFIGRRTMRMISSAYAGQSLTGTGSVESVEAGTDGGTEAVVSVRAGTEDGVCATARITLRDRIPSLT